MPRFYALMTLINLNNCVQRCNLDCAPPLYNLISVLVSVPRVQIILIAQVFNGCLLPFFAICLLLCLNDPQFMHSSPQKLWANGFMVVSVSFTLFLSSNVVIQKLFGHLLEGPHLKMVIAGCVTVCSMVILCLVTTLGKELVSPLRRPRTPPATAIPEA